MAQAKIIYEPHPVTPERKAELRAQGFKIIDARFAPENVAESEELAGDKPEKASPQKAARSGAGKGKKVAEPAKDGAASNPDDGEEELAPAAGAPEGE